MKVFELSRRSFLIVAFTAVVVVACTAVIGWQYRSNLDYKGMRVTGINVVTSEEVTALAAVPDDMLHYSIAVDSVRLRIEKHPWIGSADVRRTAVGKLNIQIVERRPVALAAVNGVPDHYLDASGFRIPLAQGVAFDLPVVSGHVGRYGTDAPNQRVSDRSLREMLNALDKLDERTLALVSEIQVKSTGSISIQTIAIPGRKSIPVVLGEMDFERKLIRLAAFWEQVVLKKPEATISTIDLRYDNLISTT
ncbi:MAG: FtsQ-type POTRA domain-containing protein [Rhodothermales bacterium]|nr:FtsQ-type POTRA domain-containing protein [Rhodothermales bacterium]